MDENDSLLNEMIARNKSLAADVIKIQNKNNLTKNEIKKYEKNLKRIMRKKMKIDKKIHKDNVKKSKEINNLIKKSKLK